MKKLETDTLLRMNGNLIEMKENMKSKRKMMSYMEAQFYLKNKGLKTMEDYNKFYDENSEECFNIGLPKYPEFFWK